VKEQGVITKIISLKLVEVAFQRSESCSKCQLCKDVGEGMVGIEAVNEVGAKHEDIVEIEIPSKEVVKGSVVVFLIPVFFLIIGYLLGSYISRLFGLEGWEEVFGVLGSLVLLFLSFFVIKWYDQNIQQKEALRARITKVISSS